MGILHTTMTDQLAEICAKTYKEQAVWFLNCFWEEFAEKEAETVWKYVLKNNELDLENHENGSGLDEMKAHVFLENFAETLTVREMRDKLRSTGAIGQNDRPKTVPITHYLLYKYNADWKTLIDKTRQGDNKEEMQKAQEMLAEVQEAFRVSEAKASEARQALLEAQQKESAAVSRENEAKAREAEAKASEAEAKAREADAKAREADAKASEEEAVKRENEARQAEAPFKAAQDEVLSALAEVKKQEDEYNGKIADCERRSTQGGVVQQNKAKAELAQLKAEDPLPLSRAKITLEAAEKRAAKARAPFEAATKIATEARDVATSARKEAEGARAEAAKAREAATASREEANRQREAAEKAREAATASRKEAEQARAASEQAKEAAENALNEASRQLDEAEAYLAEVKSKPGVSFGAIWWIDRELHEQKKFLPTSRGGIAK